MSSSKESDKRRLPAWISSKDDAGKSSASRSSPSLEVEKRIKLAASNSSAIDFPNLLKGVVFVLSGFVNPERSTLRSQALAMGAEYQADWNADCTLLVCAFPGTPKFRQVESACGTIVSKDWISECYTKKKLVDIDGYLMHAGNPWRRAISSRETGHGQHDSASKINRKQVEGSRSKQIASTSAEKISSLTYVTTERFSPDNVREWAINDLNTTISWLEAQEEKPEASEIKQIAAGGILTCLQDAIDSLDQKQDIRQIMEQWNFVPRVVEELAKLEAKRDNTSGSTSKNNDLIRQAKACKEIYDVEFNGHTIKDKRPKTVEGRKGEIGQTKSTAEYDSDETIEMTEEEIDFAFHSVASKSA